MDSDSPFGIFHLYLWSPPLFIEVPVPRQDSERSCICVLGVSILPLSTILTFILELFRQCDIFCLLWFYFLNFRKYYFQISHVQCQISQQVVYFINKSELNNHKIGKYMSMCWWNNSWQSQICWITSFLKYSKRHVLNFVQHKYSILWTFTKIKFQVKLFQTKICCHVEYHNSCT
jgi:hypothetical protein